MIGITTPLEMDWSSLLHCFESSFTRPRDCQELQTFATRRCRLAESRAPDDLKRTAAKNAKPGSNPGNLLMKTHCTLVLALLILIALLPGTTRAQTVFSGAGTTAATA